MKQWQNLTDMFKDDDDVSEEMIKKYKNTILGIKTPTVTVFATFVGFADNGMFLFKTKEQHTIKLSKDTEAEIFIPNPEKGLYNSPKGALFFQRHPKRQWKRGLNGENTQIFSVHIDFIPNTMLGNGNSFNYNWPFVLEEEGTKLLSMEEAKKQADSVGSAAINRTYGLVAHPTEQSGYVLLHNRYQIGVVQDNKIKIENNIFRQEVLDTQKSWCPNYEVL